MQPLSENWRDWPPQAKLRLLETLRQTERLKDKPGGALGPEEIAEELRRCQDPETGPLYFITHYCWALNLHDEEAQEGVPPSVDLIPDWPHVRALVAAMFPAVDVVIEKSRRMMASWVMMAAVLYDLTFRDNWPMMALSRVEDDVDDGGEKSTAKSLFGKVRFLWEGLPPWLKPELQFKHLQVSNPKRNTSIAGYPSSHSPGRGGGFKRAILDEFAWVEHSEQVMASVAQACASGKVLTSTPHGKANAFYRIREAACPAFPTAETPKYATQFRRYTIHWSLHPHRDEAWKNRLIESSSMTEEAVAQEIEINYAKALSGRVYPKFMHETHVAGGALCALATLDYDARRPLYLTCDFNHDPLIWEVCQVTSEFPPFRVIGEICRRNAVVEDGLQEFIARYGSREVVNRYAAANPDWLAIYGRGGVCVAGEHGHANPVVIFGDATEEKSTVHNRVKTYQNMRAVLTEAGFTVTLKVPASNPPRDHRFQTTNDALLHRLVVIAGGCEELRKDLESGVWNKQQNDMDQKTEDGDGSGLTRSHASSALGYMLCVLHKITSAAQPMARSRAQPIRSLMPVAKRGW